MMHPAYIPTLRLPADPALPGLGALLDPARFAQAAASLLPEGARIRDCRPVYVRYKPGTNAIAVHSLQVDDRAEPILAHGKCHTAEDFAIAAAKAHEGRALQPDYGRHLAANESTQTLLFLFPHDQALDGLRFATTPKKIQRALYALDATLSEQTWRVSDSRMTITPVRFKPEKRAVLRIDSRARRRDGGEKRPVRVYARVDAGGDGDAVAALMDRLHGEFRGHLWLQTPQVIGRIAAESTTLVADLGGGPLPKGSAGAISAGGALAALHNASTTGLEVRDPAAALQAVSETLRGLGDVIPELAPEADAVLRLLEARVARVADAGRVGFVHGDFHPQQLLQRSEDIAVLDFDRSCAGDPAADLGNFRAHLIWQALQAGLATHTARSRGDIFVSAYARAGGFTPPDAELAFWTAVGLAHLTPWPFRVLHPQWPNLTADLLAACREALA